MNTRTSENLLLFLLLFLLIILEQLKLFRVLFNRICQRDECVRIWKQLARELMLTNEVINDIEQQYPSKHERCLRSLEYWALNQTRADVACLTKIIRILGFKSLARMFTLFDFTTIVFFLYSIEILLGEIENMA